VLTAAFSGGGVLDLFRDQLAGVVVGVLGGVAALVDLLDHLAVGVVDGAGAERGGVGDRDRPALWS
jgi:hypothetical protein